MCARYQITSPPDAVRAFFAYVEEPDFPARDAIAPTQPVPIVHENAFAADSARHFSLVRWGFLPGFVKDPKTFPLLFNARAEGIADKPSFRAAVRRRRCLFIADGWVEWSRATDARGKAIKRPYAIRRPDRGLFGVAGLYETWSDPFGGEVDTGCMITVAANTPLSAIHHRMPAIIAPDDFDLWLNCKQDQYTEALRLLRPAPDNLVDYFAMETAPPARKPAKVSGKKLNGQPSFFD